MLNGVSDQRLGNAQLWWARVGGLWTVGTSTMTHSFKTTLLNSVDVEIKLMHSRDSICWVSSLWQVLVSRLSPTAWCLWRCCRWCLGQYYHRIVEPFWLEDTLNIIESTYAYPFSYCTSITLFVIQLFLLQFLLLNEGAQSVLCFSCCTFQLANM